jgi:hypothetical protein
MAGFTWHPLMLPIKRMTVRRAPAIKRGFVVAITTLKNKNVPKNSTK